MLTLSRQQNSIMRQIPGQNEAAAALLPTAALCAGGQLAFPSAGVRINVAGHLLLRTEQVVAGGSPPTELRDSCMEA